MGIAIAAPMIIICVIVLVFVIFVYLIVYAKVMRDAAIYYKQKSNALKLELNRLLEREK